MSSLHSGLSSQIPNLKSPLRTVVLLGLVTFLSYLAAELGGGLVLRPQMVWPVWPGCAILVAVLLSMPRKMWPILIAAGLAGFGIYDLQVGLTFRSIATLLLADTVEILIIALGVSYSLGDPPQLNSIRSLARYSFFAIVLAPLSSAFIATSAFAADYWIRWRIGFFTEALALLTLTPAILGWVNARREWTPKSRTFYVEAATLIAGLTLLGYIAFVAPVSISPPVLLYSLLPLLLWSALRFGMVGISTSLIVVAFLSVWGAVHGRGPFTRLEPLNNVMSLQLFLFFTASTFMVLAVLVEEQKQTERAFRESEKRFRLVADTAPVLIWMSDTDKFCTYFNKPWLDFTGRSFDSELGHGWADGVHPDDLRKCVETYAQAFDLREEFRMEYRLRRHDGEYRWVLDIGVPRFNPDRSFIGYIGVGVDVSERRQAQEALRESEERLRLAVHAGRMYAFEWDLATDVIVRSSESTNILKWPSDSTLDTGRQFVAAVHPEDLQVYTTAEVGLTPEEPTYQLRFRLVHPDGAITWLEDSGRAIFDTQGKIMRVVGMVADVSDRKRAEEALSSVNRRLIEAQEQERTRIARELHDDIGQRLALLAVELQQVREEATDLGEVLNRIGELQKQTADIATDIQALSHELHSAKLEYLGIVSAMRGFCQEFAKQTKVKVDFKSHDLPSPLPPDTSLCLFRVLQEALHNSVKHSGMKQVEVKLWETSDEVHLTVSDFGAGFDSETIKEGRGLGLFSMEERLKLLNGAFSIESQPKHGTTIHARVPLSRGSDPMRAAG
jgi:PAS domain S-box-containing protein